MRSYLPDEDGHADVSRIREHAFRALDALHLAIAQLAVPPLAEPRETIAFVSRDSLQASVATELGFERL